MLTKFQIDKRRREGRYLRGAVMAERVKFANERRGSDEPQDI
jgi:hypothetical protein